jgi:hypothetical protein
VALRALNVNTVVAGGLRVPRFVILEHDHPELHWDLMLETGASLRTWRLARPPQTPGDAIEALPLANHRLHYLDYEGPVSGGRGVVKCWDAGNYDEVDADHVRLQGARVRGLVRLTQTGASGWSFELVGP